MEQALPGARIVAFGHLGDGNFHYSALTPAAMADGAFAGAALSDIVHEIAHALGGSISAEHGIGVARKGDFARFKQPESLALMRVLKHALDPKGVMNPRVMFD